MAVAQEVLDGLPDTAPVVDYDRRRGRPGLGVAYGHHGLARRRLELLHIAHGLGGDSYEAGDPAPTHRAQLSPGRVVMGTPARACRLHGGDARPGLRCRPQDGRDNGPVVGPERYGDSTPMIGPSNTCSRSPGAPSNAQRDVHMAFIVGPSPGLKTDRAPSRPLPPVQYKLQYVAQYRPRYKHQ